LPVAGPVLGVDRVVGDRRIEPEPEAVVRAVVEGRLHRCPRSAFAGAAASATATASASLRRGAFALSRGVFALGRGAFALWLGLGGLLLRGLLLDQGGLDLGFDLVAELQVAGLLVGSEVVTA